MSQPPYPPPPSPYGQDPSGQQPPGPPPHGQVPHGQVPYGQVPYGQPPYGGPVYGAPVPAYHYASWGRRVGASLIDGLLGTVASIPLIAGYVWLFASLETSPYDDSVTDYTGGAGPVVLLAVGVVAAVAFWVWNICVRQGRTGATLGKSNLGIRLLKESTGQPMGAGMSFVRQLAHYVDSFACYLGWLWPLWDEKRQTLGDKIVGTVVVVDGR